MTIWEFLFGETPPNLQRGAGGSHVEQMQGQLNRRNDAGLRIDGAFGPKTDAAVKNFQRERGLVVDGIVGPKTRAELRKWWL